MLTGLIENEKTSETSEKGGRGDDKGKMAESEDSSPERLKTKVIESMGRKRVDSDRSSSKLEE